MERKKKSIGWDDAEKGEKIDKKSAGQLSGDSSNADMFRGRKTLAAKLIRLKTGERRGKNGVLRQLISALECTGGGKREEQGIQQAWVRRVKRKKGGRW